MKIKLNWIDFVAYIVVTLFAVITLYPFVNVLAVSLSDKTAYASNPLMIIPKNINVEAYRFLLDNSALLRCYRNTLWVTFSGVAVALFLGITYAYPLASKHFMPKNFFAYTLIITMLFNGGLIPTYLLIRNLGLMDTLWALILLNSMGAFNVILLVNFFKGIPEELIEAAKIEGASDVQVLYKIILPLSSAIIATIALFVAVQKWNTYYAAIIYINDFQKWTLQVYLRELITGVTTNVLASEIKKDQYIPPTSIKYAAIIFTMLPIMLVYPFLQKYFIKGIMIGGVKG